LRGTKQSNLYNMASTFSGVIESFIKPEALKEFDTLGSKIDASLKGFDAVIAKAALLSTEIQKGGAAYSQYIAASTKIADVNKQLQTTQGSVNTNLSAYNKLLSETANTIKDNTGATDDQARRIIALRTELSKTKDAVEVYQKLIREVNKENPASLSDKTFNQVFDAFGSDTANSIKQAFDNLDSSTKPDFIQQLTTDAAQFLEIQKQLEQELKDTAIAFRLQTKEIVAGEGSIDQLGARLENLQKAYSALNTADRESALGVDLKKQINDLDKEVKELEVGIGKTRRLVGDYANQISQGLSPAFTLLNDQLQENNKLMQDAAKFSELSADAQAQLVTETEALNVLLQKSVATIGDLKAQNTALQKTLLALEAANLKGSESYKIIQAELIKGTKAVNDLRGEVRALQSDTRALDQVIGVASSLVAVYQTGAAAMQLFGEESEDTQRAIAKLVAVQSVLNGLQTIQQQLTQRGTVLNRAYAFAQGQIAIAMDTTAASGARLRAVFVTLGIGAIIVGIGLLVNKMIELSTATKKTSVEFDALNDGSVKEASKTINELQINIDLAKKGLLDKKDVVNQYNDTIGKTTGTVKTLDEAEQALVKNGPAYIQMMLFKAAANIALEQAAQKAFEAEQNRRKNEEEFANSFDRAGQGQGSVPDAPGDLDAEIEQRAKERQIKRKNAAIKRSEDDRNALLDIARKFQSDAAKIAKDFNFNFFETKEDKKEKKSDDSLQREVKARLELFKKLKEQQIKDAEDVAFFNQNDAELQIALAESVAQSKRTIIQADSQYRIKYEKLTASELKILQIDNAEKEQEIAAELVRKIFAIRMKEAERFKQSDKGIDDLFFGVNSAEKQLASVEKLSQERIAIIERSAAFELVQLERYRTEGLIKEEAYNKEILRINAEKDRKLLEEAIRVAKERLAILKTAGVDTVQAEKDLAEAEAKFLQLDKFDTLSDNEKDPVVERNKKRKASYEELVEAYKNLAYEINNTIFSLIDAQFVKQNNDIQDQIDLIEERKGKEIEAINTSTASNEDKANRIKIAEATTQAQREQLERRQRQIEVERAKFQRASQIAAIIGNTAQAVTKTLAEVAAPAGIALAIAIGAIGALQLAQILSTPLPKYLKGKEDSYEGPATVSEDGRPELRINKKTGEMSLTPNKPTLTWVSKHDRIIPHNKMKDFMNYSGIGHVPQVESKGNNGDVMFMSDPNLIAAIKNKKLNLNLNITNNMGWYDHVKRHVLN
jgi:hypothetical protein